MGDAARVKQLCKGILLSVGLGNSSGASPTTAGGSGSASGCMGTSQRGACRGASFPLPHRGAAQFNGQAAQPLRVKVVAWTQPRSCCRFRVPLDSRENWSAYALLAEGGLLRAVSCQGQ
jgi:hypothetical protein